MWRFGGSLFVLVALVSTAVQARQQPDFFAKEPAMFVCADRRPGAGDLQPREVPDSFSGLPYVLTRRESRELAGSENPSLTIASDPNSKITIIGHDRRDFSMQYCARGGGSNEAEARQRLGESGFLLNGTVVSLTNPGPQGDRPEGSFLLEAPANALTVTHTASSAVEVRNMSGNVRIAASRGRATVLDTTGQVEIDALHIDFAATRGNVKLSSMGDITLAMTKKFDGTLMAWARGAVQMLVPAGFRTPFTVIVNHAEDFVCRTDVCSKMKVTQGHKIYGPSFIYTYAGDGSAPPERFTVLSNPPWVPGNRATSKVVIDSYSDVRVKVIETGPAQKQ